MSDDTSSHVRVSHLYDELLSKRAVQQCKETHKLTPWMLVAVTFIYSLIAGTESSGPFETALCLVYTADTDKTRLSGLVLSASAV